MRWSENIRWPHPLQTLRRAADATRRSASAAALALRPTRRRISRYTGAAGTLAALLGLAVLFGWVLGAPELVRLRPTWPVVTPGAALSLALSGAALFLLSDERASALSNRLAKVAAAVATLIGLTSLIDRLYGTSLTFERLFLPSQLQEMLISPGDAISLVLVGVGLLLVDTETRLARRPTELCALLAVAISFPSLIGHAYGVLPADSNGSGLLCSPILGAGIVIVATGLLFARPHRGFTAILTEDGIGGLAARRVLPYLIGVPFVVGGVLLALVRGGMLDAEILPMIYAYTTMVVLAAVGFLTAVSFHRSDAERRRTERLLVAQNAATRALTQSPTVAQAIPLILSSFAESLGWDVGTLWKIDPKARVVRCSDVWHRPNLDVKTFEQRTRELAFPIGVDTPGRVWMTKEPAWVPDLTRYPNFRKAQAEVHGLHAAFAFPITYLDEVTGVMEFFARDLREPEGDIVAMATILGSQVGEAIERKSAEERLRASEEHFRAVAENATDALISVDEGERITFFNAAAERMFRLGAGRAVDRPIHDLLPQLQLGAAVPEEIVAHRADGTQFPSDISLASWRSAGGARFVTAILRDVTARKQVEAELRRAHAAAEATNRELEAFSYSVSHDLQKPLRAIEGFSRALLDEYGSRLDAPAQQYVFHIGDAARRMSSLIDDLLQLAHTARAELHIERIDLSAVARDVVAELQRNQPRTGLKLRVQEGLTCWGDPGLLRAVLENLLGNAWKFTSKQPDALIEFGGRSLDSEETYFVRDNGAGFDPAFAQRLYQPFERLHKQSDFPGSGIGLALVQRVVQRHGGRVWAEGAVNKGATFYFALPNPARRP